MNHAIANTAAHSVENSVESVMDNSQAEMLSLHAAVPLTVSRRGFVVTSLAAGFAASVLPVSAQTIATDSQGLDVGEIKIPVADGTLPGYMARPQGRKATAVVLVVQEVFGVHEHIKDICRRLAKAGYTAIAPELYARQGDPRQYPDTATLVAQLVSKIPDAQVLSDLDACVAYARAQGANTRKLAITGFCWGGRITWLYAAHNKNVTAAVAWYGRLIGPTNPVTPKNPIDIANGLQVPVLGLYGGQDGGIPVSSISQMQEALRQAPGKGSESRFVVYRDAPHAFNADYRPSYRKEAAQDGWQQLLAWLKHYGVV